MLIATGQITIADLNDGKNVHTRYMDTGYDNEFDGTAITPTGGTTVNSQSGGILKLTSTNTNPMINMYNLGSFDPSVYRYLGVRYRYISGTTANSWQAFYTNTTYTSANGAAVATGTLICDGEWHVSFIDLWSSANYKTGGNITGWRWDWVNDINGITMEFDWIKLFTDMSTSIKDYMGTYTDDISNDSTDPNVYSWLKIKGNQGVPGVPGPPGSSLYTWVKYADTSTGGGMADLPDGKTYIGLAYNKTTATESTVATDYTWSLIKGDQGIPGPTGYTWIKYADSPTTGMSDSPTGKTYMGIAYNKTTATESTVYADYSWSLIKGDTGADGPPGDQGPPGIHNLAENGDFEGDTSGAKANYWNSSSTARVANISTLTNGNGSNRAMELDAVNGSNANVYATNLIPVTPGQTFYVEAEGRFLNTAGTGYARIGFRQYDATKVATSTYSGIVYWGYSGEAKMTVFTKKSGKFTVPAGCYYLQLWTQFNNNGETTNKFYIDNIRVNFMATTELIVDGAIKGNHVATKTLTWEHSEGGQLVLGSAKGDGDLKVWVDKNADSILEMVGSIDDDGAYFPLVQANTIKGDVENTWQLGSINYYIDLVAGNDNNDGLSWATAKKSLKVFLDSLPKNLNGQWVQVNVRGNVIGGININGFHNGDLLIAADPNATRPKIYGPSSFNRLGRGKFLVQGFDMNGDTSSVGSAVFKASYCDFIFFYDIKIYGNSKANHAFWFDNCKFMLGECEAYGISDRGLYATNLCHGNITNNRGSVPNAILIEGGSIVTGEGTRWAGNVLRLGNSYLGGNNTDVWTVNTGTAAPAAPPEASELTLNVTASTGDNYSSGGYWTNDEVKQGDYGYGNRYGLWYFGDLRATLAGKTIVSATITFYRGSGGASGARTAYIKSHAYTSRAGRPSGLPALSGSYASTSIAVGETKTLDITSLVQTNIASGVDKSLGVSTSGSTNYMSLGIQPNLVIRYK